ncbi:MAG: hypothetical protein NZM00_02800, partial [Anaerolinea sp.]|nr:hypothetical protein [Anaerolinea sp.]
MRTVAEVIRHLGQKQVIDDEAKDMISLLVYCFREIDEGIEASAQAWEKRDYYLKAEELRTRWGWAGRMADELQQLVFTENWDALPGYLLKIVPHVSDIKITKMTRSPEEWFGRY